MDKTLEQLQAAYETAAAEQEAAQSSFEYWANRRRTSSAPWVDKEYQAAKARRNAGDAALDAAYEAVEAVDPSN
jgi:light-regulated signal transduction histidine kinase (bacteriophytochrome)